MDPPATMETSTTTPRINLMDLPLELHIQIASFLSYPDALALKHSCSHFYYMIYTGVHLKVDWLVERFERKLECPMEKCSFRTDEAFCNWRIRRIMERRRQHLECRRTPGGCWVVEGQTCQSDLVPLWLKRQGPRRIARSLAMIGREAFIIGSFAIMLELLWHFARSHVVDLLARSSSG
ncbi:Putative F-box domain protein [Penicillium brasilianum]|uniref:Putative F-box domain protein n=1 Tax=Penicillium brasilianum TaxID=104259 RepID=A0A0F7VF21_PENBI|nr:Putative F-box domain protein [Penicillium brasilianum]